MEVGVVNLHGACSGRGWRRPACACPVLTPSLCVEGRWHWGGAFSQLDVLWVRAGWTEPERAEGEPRAGEVIRFLSLSTEHGWPPRRRTWVRSGVLSVFWELTCKSPPRHLLPAVRQDEAPGQTAPTGLGRMLVESHSLPTSSDGLDVGGCGARGQGCPPGPSALRVCVKRHDPRHSWDCPWGLHSDAGSCV